MTDEKDSEIIAMGDHSKIIEEFQYLLEKSQQLFAGLRDLPGTANSKSWQSHFHRAFEVYTKLWKFQQIHRRQVLENKDFYGLKRWEIGEIASKIGQLYYHYYLRTSETTYLKESLVFYEAIKERGYFNNILEMKNPAFVIKKLRYYARYAVVTLLLDMQDATDSIIEEFSFLVEEYSRIFKLADASEWRIIIKEITNFQLSQSKASPTNYLGKKFKEPIRLPSNSKSLQEQSFVIDEAVIVGSFPDQAKFSELTIDMFRFLQSIELEPTAISEDNEKSKSNRVGPRKFLLYKPTISQFLIYLSTAFKEIHHRNGSKEKVSNISNLGYSGSTLSISKKSEDENSQADSVLHLHPGDLLPFTRVPLFIIIESDSCGSFKSFPQVFNQPLVCLLSPSEIPPDIKDVGGNLFTLFLVSPLLAFCAVCDLAELGHEVWKSLSDKLQAIERLIEWLFQTSPGLDKSFKRYMSNEFTCRYLTRFVFCSSVLNVHISFKDIKYLPSCYPLLPPALSNSTELQSQIQQLIITAKATDKFNINRESS